MIWVVSLGFLLGSLLLFFGGSGATRWIALFPWTYILILGAGLGYIEYRFLALAFPGMQLVSLVFYVPIIAGLWKLANKLIFHR